MLVMAAIWELQLPDKAREKDEKSKVWLIFKAFLQDEYLGDKNPGYPLLLEFQTVDVPISPHQGFRIRLSIRARFWGNEVPRYQNQRMLFLCTARARVPFISIKPCLSRYIWLIRGKVPAQKTMVSTSNKIICATNINVRGDETMVFE
jgi:hypothetical protein